MRQQAAEQVHKSEARLQAAIDLVGLSPYAWNPATGALEWDARLKAMWGLPADARVDTEMWMSGIHPDDRSRAETAIAHCLDPAGHGIYAIEHRVIGATDGVERWVSAHGRTIFDNGQAVGFIGAALDITDRKTADHALRDSEERFRQFAAHSVNVLWIVDLDSMRIAYLSPAFERIWGKPRDAMLGDVSRWGESIHSEDRRRALDAIGSVRLGEVTTEEYRILRPDGAVRWIRNILFPIRDAQRRVWQAGGIAQDITRHEGNCVYIVDANEASRQSLSQLLRDSGYQVRGFLSDTAFLEVAPALSAGCVVIDIRGAGAGGLAIPQKLKARRIGLPAIVLGEATGDVTFAVQVMKSGAVDFLPAPHGRDQLLGAVAAASAEIRSLETHDQETDRARKRIAEMPQREREVLEGLLAGKTNKQIARDLGISPRTVEIHRAHVMQRLGARNLSEAVLIAASAGVQSRPRSADESES
jgi:PAS domain S-box-containing protein